MRDNQKIQDEIFRNMSGSKRVAAAMAFSDMIRRIAEDGVRHLRPNLGDEGIRREVARRIALNNDELWRNKSKSFEKS